MPPLSGFVKNISKRGYLSLSQHRHRLILVISILLTAGLITTATVNNHVIARQLHTWKVLPEPERLTELYFTDHAKLPTVFFAGQQKTIGFTVHNLEYRTISYAFTVTQVSEDSTQRQELGSGSFTLKQGQSKTTPVQLTFANFVHRSQITVALKGSGEAVHFWISKVGS